MAGPVDFLRLYQELGLPTTASFEDMKRAYRRRVAELHPDRLVHADRVGERHAVERMQRLTVLYDAASAFHQQHGRLPGAPAPRAPQPPYAPRVAVPAAPRRSGGRRFALAALVAAVLIAWFWNRQGASDDVAVDTAPTMPQPARLPRAAAVEPVRHEAPYTHGHPLAVGMPMEEVLGLEGEPVLESDDRFEYGPSWIAFEKGKVAAWHSSPLRPLRSATSEDSPPAPPPRRHR
jgi:hypothetical protein